MGDTRFRTFSVMRGTAIIDGLRRIAWRLRGDRRGNATVLVAIAIPALIGGTGLAVDTAQWYAWKREMQFAVDQAALAGAWSRVSDGTAGDYQTRAVQELQANQQIVDFAEQPEVVLADYAGGTDNSVVVTLSATRELPFSGFITGNPTTVRVTAQAAISEETAFTSCLLAVDDDESGAVTIGGNASVTARCGIAALSNAAEAITVNGNPSIDPGWLVAAGGIDDWFDENTDASVNEFVSGLVDPFASLSPPDNPSPQTYACTGGTVSYTAVGTRRILVQEKYYSGTKSNKVDTLYNTVTLSDETAAYSAPASKNTKTGVSTSDQTVTGAVTSSTSGSGKNAVTTYYRKDTVTTTTITITAINQITTPYGANLQPGTYASIDISCDTTMASGIYVIDGGMFSINAQNSVLAPGIMIVLKNGAGFKINGGASVNLSAATAAQLMTAGIGEEQASKLAGMLVFEDRNSPGNASAGNNANRINGNASTILDGKIYLPKSPIIINGTASVSSQCLMIAANTITILGTADLSTFCPPDQELTDEIVSIAASVKLVT